MSGMSGARRSCGSFFGRSGGRVSGKALAKECQISDGPRVAADVFFVASQAGVPRKSLRKGLGRPVILSKNDFKARRGLRTSFCVVLLFRGLRASSGFQDLF